MTEEEEIMQMMEDMAQDAFINGAETMLEGVKQALKSIEEDTVEVVLLLEMVDSMRLERVESAGEMH